MTDPSSGRSALAAYRALPSLAGWGYLIATSLGRLPVSMVPLAILTLATSATGSIAVGGVAAAATALGEAVGAPVGGALSDRWGQRRVLLIGVVTNVASVVAFVLAVGHVPDGLAVALAGLAGLSLPQVGPLSRVRWLAMSRDDVSAAFAFEGVVDEVVYIIGPALVGIVAVVLSPQLSLLAAAALIAVFVTQFALHRSAALVPRREPTTDADVVAAAEGGRARSAMAALVLAGMLAMGVFFGASQAGLTAFARTQGVPDAGALFYAVMAIGSAVTTMAMVALPSTIGPWMRWIGAAVGMALGGIGMTLAPTVPILLMFAVFAGAFQGPALLTLYSVAGSIAERTRAGVLMTLTGSGVVLGVGIGTAVGGAGAAIGGAAAAFSLVVAASVLLALLGGVAGVLGRERR